jgi:hypothetical protein
MDSDKRKPKYTDENLSHAILSTTNPTRTGVGSKPGFWSERLATNSVRHGTAENDFVLAT